MKDTDNLPFFLKKTKQFYERIRELADRIKMTEHTFILITAVIIGLLGGYGAVLIQYAIKVFQKLFWQNEFHLETIYDTPWYWKLIIPAVGGIIVGLIIHFVAKEAKGHGVPEVMEAIALRNGIIRVRVVLSKLFASAICIASGGSVGREGPVVQIGSAVGSTVGQFFKVNPKRMRVFVACGAASGIAAAFNAPVAGALFAVEIILGDFAVAHFSPIVISSVTATIISRHYLGDFPAFTVPVYQLVSPLEYINYIVLGFLAGGAALLFIKVLYRTEDFFNTIKLPDYIKGGMGGLTVGCIGIFLPHIFGVGYDTMDLTLKGNQLWYFALILLFAKIGATSISLGSGGSGGIFAPSLFIGAMLGSAFGGLVNILFPEWTADSGAYALVAMGGVVGAATHGPIAAILIIFELTNDYKTILPLMITTIIATLLAIRFKKESIYTLKLVRRGIDIFAGREVNVLKSLKVSDVVKKSICLINERATFDEVLQHIVKSVHNYIYVTDEKNQLTGYISMSEIRQTIQEYDTLKNILIAKDLLNPHVHILRESDNLDYAMKQFGQIGIDELPVICNNGENKIVGTIWQTDVISAYNQQIFLKDMSGESGRSLQNISQDKIVHVVENYHFHEKEVPVTFVGRSVGEIGMRQKYQIEILLIRRKKIENQQQKFYYIQPYAETILEANDMLLLFGKRDDLKKFEKI
ncbi:MAG: chloride channel protein [Calditrichaceae bacterium]|nr:chloride channel protein [Calditrichaceae bacterium]MBN2709598.1 chloride channel protein [Calditrichaceae bacterium]RQV92396.1 MAG: CBS domain-containing protein [Calditrichota bacterium]